MKFKITLLVLASYLVVLCMGQQSKNQITSQDKAFWKLAKIPPMGWNSWDCFGPTVTEKEVKANADYMSENLKQHGWEYVIVDIRWYVENDKGGGYNETDLIYTMDK